MPLKSAQWRKSSYSTSSGGNCVELAETKTEADAVDAVAARDSKDPDGPVLLVTRAALRTAVGSTLSVR
jgi:hypothetical protein